MPSAPRARSPFSPKSFPSCGGCVSPRSRKRAQRTMTTTLLTSMNSVEILRGALTRLSQAGLTQAALQQPDLLSRAIQSDHDFITLAHEHQEPPAFANNGGPWTTWLGLGG